MPPQSPNLGQPRRSLQPMPRRNLGSELLVALAAFGALALAVVAGVVLTLTLSIQTTPIPTLTVPVSAPITTSPIGTASVAAVLHATQSVPTTASPNTLDTHVPATVLLTPSGGAAVQAVGTQATTSPA